MRFMMFMIPKVYQPDTPVGQRAEDGFAPPADAVKEMMKFNEALADAGMLISLDGLHPSSKASRVSFKKGSPKVTDGPFAEAKEVIGGYWLIKANSLQEAVSWAQRVPAAEGDVIEIRQVFDMTDWPEDVQRAADSAKVRAQIEHNG